MFGCRMKRELLIYGAAGSLGLGCSERFEARV